MKAKCKELEPQEFTNVQDKEIVLKEKDPVAANDTSAQNDEPAAPEISNVSEKDLQVQEIVKQELFYLLLAYFACRLPWIFMLPMSEAPDEFAHFWVIKFLKEHWRLPAAQEVLSGGPSAVYGSLPQLGYIPHLICGQLAPQQFLALSGRFGSTIGGAVMLFAAFKIGQILFPKSKLAALALPAAIVCHPQLVFIHSYANSDSTSSALASLLIWLMLETVSKGLTARRTITMGALVGWLAITKYSGLAIIPVLGLAIIASLFVHGTSLTLAAGSIAAAGAVAILLSAWWFIQNAKQYPGDFMGTHTMYKSWAETFHREMHYYLPPSHIIKSLRWWRMTFFSYWGLFGYMNKYLTRSVYIAYFGLVLIAVLGGLNGARKLLQNLLRSGADRPSPSSIIMWSSLAMTVLVNITSMIWASVYNLGGPQGRYLITSEIPIMALIIGGFGLLGKKPGNWAIIGFLLFNVAVSVGSWIYLFNLYHGWHLDPLV